MKPTKHEQIIIFQNLTLCMENLDKKKLNEKAD